MTLGIAIGVAGTVIAIAIYKLPALYRRYKDALET